ncbi:MAG: DUF1194 domain-containing protein [Alphaproteobacteria bacterium]|nr:DUF1194 domain-containing protein [Alphaproteobacteria bacterium]
MMRFTCNHISVFSSALRLTAVFGFCLVWLSPVSSAHAEEVAVELILAIDCSSSVEPHEYSLQMRGVAAAFRSPGVIQALSAAAPNGIAVTLVQWSGASMHTQAIPWTHIHNKQSAAEFASEVEQAPRYMRWGATAIGEALSFSLGLFEDNSFEGVRHVIDVSGDGSSNQGVFPTEVRPIIVAAGVTINGLAILNDEPDLAQYYKKQVAGGKRSFVESAKNFADFAGAIRRKLIREIGSPPSVRLDTQTAQKTNAASAENLPIQR